MPNHLTGLLTTIPSPIARIFDVCLEGRDLKEKDIASLFTLNGADFLVLLLVADHLRHQTVGGVVAYVVNRNINFTNVCIKRCGFCAFSRTHRADETYYLPIEEIVRRASEAQRLGATEVCIQAGLPPDMPGDLYIQICRALKEALPQLHIHAFSPEEVLYGARRSGITVNEYLRELRDAGIGSLPGTSAEILDDSLRERISPGRISTAQWKDVIATAHSLGIPTTSTMMYGHLETPEQCARHLLLLRDLQRQTGGFSEFVPLGFIHSQAPMYLQDRIPTLQPGPTGITTLRVHAISRLVLNRDIPNLQVSWVKEGLKLAQACLAAGANDLGGTLINESISTAAGAEHGQMLRPAALRQCIQDAGRVAAERSTLYQILRRFDAGENAEPGPLDLLSEVDLAGLGSYSELIRNEEFSYSGRLRPTPLAKTPIPSGGPDPG